MHNLLITGGDQSDRMSYAIERAQLLLCAHPERKFPCGDCINCKRVKSNTHPNIIFIEPQNLTANKLPKDDSFAVQTIKIDQIRQIIVESQKTNFEQGRGIFIITHMHKATSAAANALLKVIEESNQSKVFMALAPSRMAVLSTIASRLMCHIVKPADTFTINEERRKKIHTITTTPPKERFVFCSQLSADRDELMLELFELTNTCHAMLRANEIFSLLALKLSLALMEASESLKKNLNPRLVIEVLVLQKWPFQP